MYTIAGHRIINFVAGSKPSMSRSPHNQSHPASSILIGSAHPATFRLTRQNELNLTHKLHEQLPKSPPAVDFFLPRKNPWNFSRSPSWAPQKRRRQNSEREAGCAIHKRHRLWSIARRDTPRLPQLLSHHKNLGCPQAPDPVGTSIRSCWRHPSSPPERTLACSVTVLCG
jgi:hypothetical protein